MRWRFVRALSSSPGSQLYSRLKRSEPGKFEIRKSKPETIPNIKMSKTEVETLL
jgi:hypothetical protein